MTTERHDYPDHAAEPSGIRFSVKNIVAGAALVGVLGAGFLGREAITEAADVATAQLACMVIDCAPGPDANIDPLDVMGQGK